MTGSEYAWCALPLGVESEYSGFGFGTEGIIRAEPAEAGDGELEAEEDAEEIEGFLCMRCGPAAMTGEEDPLASSSGRAARIPNPRSGGRGRAKREERCSLGQAGGGGAGSCPSATEVHKTSDSWSSTAAPADSPEGGDGDKMPRKRLEPADRWRPRLSMGAPTIAVVIASKPEGIPSQPVPICHAEDEIKGVGRWKLQISSSMRSLSPSVASFRRVNRFGLATTPLRFPSPHAVEAPQAKAALETWNLEAGCN